MEKKAESSWVDTDCLKVFVFFFQRKLEDNIFKVVQLFMFWDLLSLFIQQH